MTLQHCQFCDAHSHFRAHFRTRPNTRNINMHSECGLTVIQAMAMANGDAADKTQSLLQLNMGADTTSDTLALICSKKKLTTVRLIQVAKESEACFELQFV